MRSEIRNYATHIFRYVIGACAFAMLAAIVMYAYLGTFSRYLSDDYCEAVRFENSSPVAAVIERYTAENWPRATMRYSNLLFIGFSELMGKNNMPITITSMVLLWVANLVWCVYEIRKALKIDWVGQMDIFFGSTLGFFSLLQAPNLFQTIYWRSAMMTHFAPLVFGSFLFAFLVKQMRLVESQSVSQSINLIIFFAAFIIAGFSEPPTTTMLAALPLLMIVVWILGKPSSKQKQLTLLAWAFAGVFLGLMAMILSPASTSMAQEKTLNIVEILGNSFLYSFLFMIDSLRTLPLPFFISALIPLMLIWLYHQVGTSTLPREKKRSILLLMIVIPFLVWLLIAAGFSPSVYGQGFPVERMRFLARTLMIAAFMVEGILFGLLLKDLQFKPNREIGRWAVLVLFASLAIVYPLRTLFNINKFNVPEYRARAELWDLREAYILRYAGFGESDLIVPGFPGVYQIKELDSDPNHWVNKCAAQYYGVNSIRSVTVPDENMLEYLNE
ncbi:MAG: hypothetical protein FJZ86_05295 [Chloroflexi bacterium]|nr:hypothetical protein [Chloroflexota bacterium]